jgi:hypothetical protein
MSDLNSSNEIIPIRYEQICDTKGFCLIKIIPTIETKIDPNLIEETLVEVKEVKTEITENKPPESISKSSQKVKIKSGFRGSKK